MPQRIAEAVRSMHVLHNYVKTASRLEMPCINISAPFTIYGLDLPFNNASCRRVCCIVRDLCWRWRRQEWRHQPWLTGVAAVTKQQAVVVSTGQLDCQGALSKNPRVVGAPRPPCNHVANARRGVNDHLYVDRMVPMAVDVRLFVHMWCLDPNMGTVNSTHDQRKAGHVEEPLLQGWTLRCVRPSASLNPFSN